MTRASVVLDGIAFAISGFQTLDHFFTKRSETASTVYQDTSVTMKAIATCMVREILTGRFDPDDEPLDQWPRWHQLGPDARDLRLPSVELYVSALAAMKANAQDLARIKRALEGMVNTANDSSREAYADTMSPSTKPSTTPRTIWCGHSLAACCALPLVS